MSVESPTKHQTLQKLFVQNLQVYYLPFNHQVLYWKLLESLVSGRLVEYLTKPLCWAAAPALDSTLDSSKGISGVKNDDGHGGARQIKTQRAANTFTRFDNSTMWLCK